MIYILQILALVFAYACARHDVPAVDNFTFYGSNKKHQSAFHRYNWILKACYVTAVWLLHSWELGVMSFVIIWGLFDPVVAICRTVYTPPKKPWYYLSTGNFTDRTLLKVFGSKAGIYKAVLCLAVIITLNILYDHGRAIQAVRNVISC